MTTGDQQDIPESLCGMAWAYSPSRILHLVSAVGQMLGGAVWLGVFWALVLLLVPHTSHRMCLCPCAMPTVGALGDGCICRINLAIPGGTALPCPFAGGHLGTLGVGIRTAWVGIRATVSGVRNPSPGKYWTTPASTGALGGVSKLWAGVLACL